MKLTFDLMLIYYYKSFIKNPFYWIYIKILYFKQQLNKGKMNVYLQYKHSMFWMKDKVTQHHVLIMMIVNVYEFCFRHGDMLFLLSSDRKQSNASLDNTSMNSASGTSNITGDMGSVSISGSPMSSGSSQSVVEDEVDQILYKEDGKIYRSRNEQL